MNARERDTAKQVVLHTAERQFGRFLVSQWLASGLDAARLQRAVARGEFEREWPGVIRIVGTPSTWRGRVFAVTATHQGLVLAARRTALRLHGLDAWRDARVHVVIPHWVRYDFDHRVVVHRTRTMAPEQRTNVGPIGITTVARSLVDDGIDGVTERWAELVAEAVRRGLVTRAELGEALEQAGRIPGRRKMREVIDFLDPEVERARSLPEIDLRRVASEIVGSRALLNHRIRDASGRDLGEFDAVFPDLLLCIEGDSRAWHVQPQRMEADLRRDMELRRAHWIVVRIPLVWLRTRPDLVRQAIMDGHRLALERLHLVPAAARRAAQAA